MSAKAGEPNNGLQLVPAALESEVRLLEEDGEITALARDTCRRSGTLAGVSANLSWSDLREFNERVVDVSWFQEISIELHGWLLELDATTMRRVEDLRVGSRAPFSPAITSTCARLAEADHPLAATNLNLLLQQDLCPPRCCMELQRAEKRGQSPSRCLRSSLTASQQDARQDDGTSCYSIASESFSGEQELYSGPARREAMLAGKSGRAGAAAGSARAFLS